MGETPYSEVIGRRLRRFRAAATRRRGSAVRWVAGRRVLSGRTALLAAGLIAAGVLGLWLALDGGGFDGGSSARAGDPVVIFKNPQSANLWLCSKKAARCDGAGQSEVVINEEVANIPSGTHVGGFELLIYYAPDTVNVSVAEGPFLGSTGRHTACLQQQSENWLRFGCTSTGSGPWPGGSGILAYLTVKPNPDLVLRPTLGNGIVVPLIDSSSQSELTDEWGEPIPIEEVLNSTVLVRALEGDVNRDCRVNVIDEQSVSGRYGSSFGIWPYQPFFDLEPSVPDSDIDIKDLQFVYGRDGNTCEGPPPLVETPTPTATVTYTPTASGTATAVATATPVGTQTATPVSSQTPTPAPGTPTMTQTPAAFTVTPTSTAPSGTPTKTRTPTRTPRPGKHTRTPTPRTPSVTPTATVTPVSTATPTPPSEVVPAERTPGPGRAISPAEVTPGPAEGLPTAGDGASGGGGSRVLLAAAALAVAAWSVLAMVLAVEAAGASRAGEWGIKDRRRRARRFRGLGLDTGRWAADMILRKCGIFRERKR